MTVRQARNAPRREWLDACPLRAWRTREQVSIMTAASMIGCSTSTIQKWEAGASVPTDESYESIARAMGLKRGSSVRAAWRRWLAPMRPTTVT